MNKKKEPIERIRRIRSDLGSRRVPYNMHSHRCHYVPLQLLGKIPDGLALNCRWGGCLYERAYLADGKWFLVWDDKEMPTPDGVQVRTGLYNPP